MPSLAITVALNYDQSKKFALLPGQNKATLREIILREARNKFRVKALSVVFLRGGTLFEESDTLAESVTQVWVGKGEPYAGPPADIGRSANPGEVRVIRYVTVRHCPQQFGSFTRDSGIKASSMERP